MFTSIYNIFNSYFPMISKISAADIDSVSKLDYEAYVGKPSNPEDIKKGSDVTIGSNEFKQWYAKYNSGAFVLSRRRIIGYHLYKKEVIGSFGLWPIDKATYERCIDGRIVEPEVNVVTPTETKHKYWYLSDIVLKDELRNRGLGILGLGNDLIYGSLKLWHKRGNMTDPVCLCAIPVPSKSTIDNKIPSTARLLAKYEFDKSQNINRENFYCYTKEMDLSEIEKIYNGYLFKSRQISVQRILNMLKMTILIISKKGGIDSTK